MLFKTVLLFSLFKKPSSILSIPSPFYPTSYIILHYLPWHLLKNDQQAKNLPQSSLLQYLAHLVVDQVHTIH